VATDPSEEVLSVTDQNDREQGPAQNDGSIVVTEEDRRRDTYSPQEHTDGRVQISNTY
jgi:hypothetical protein